jgi:hypothetical protein
MKGFSCWLLAVILCLGFTKGAAFRKLTLNACQVLSASSSAPPSKRTSDVPLPKTLALELRGGGWIVPVGWNPFGYKVTALGDEFLAFEGSLDGDLGRFLASVRKRKTKAALKANWVEVVRVAKTRQSSRIYRLLDDFLAFCLKAGFLD